MSQRQITPTVASCIFICSWFFLSFILSQDSQSIYAFLSLNMPIAFLVVEIPFLKDFHPVLVLTIINGLIYASFLWLFLYATNERKLQFLKFLSLAVIAITILAVCRLDALLKILGLPMGSSELGGDTNVIFLGALSFFSILVLSIYVFIGLEARLLFREINDGKTERTSRASDEEKENP